MTRPRRIAVLGNLDSIHTRRWLRALAERGHEMHAVSFYAPAEPLPGGVALHVLSPARSPGSAATAGSSSLLRKLPASLLRPAHGVRYLRAGLRRVLREITPDVVHAHYLVEYGFYAALAGVKPLVVSAWGSDVYVAPRDPLTNLIARWTLRRADAVTGNEPAMLEQLRSLGLPEHRSHLVRIGALEDRFFEPPAPGSQDQVSVNLQEAAVPLTVLSTRALEPLYNIDVILRAFARLDALFPAGLRLLVAHEGSERGRLESLAAESGVSAQVQFIGRLTPDAMRDALSAAHVYVSVPSSDSMAASTMEAMARGAFPVVSDLPSQRDFIEHGRSGLLVPAGDVESLTLALRRALADAALRREAVALNRATAEAEGRLSLQVDRFEALLDRYAP